MDAEISITQIQLENPSKTYCLKAIAKLEADIFHDAWSEKVLDEMLESKFNFIFAASRNEKIIGYYCMQFIAGEGELLRIAIAPDMRRKGIGSILMGHMTQTFIALKCEKLFLEVNEINSAAISLYEKNDFKRISHRKDYYGKGEHAVIMMKKLQ